LDSGEISWIALKRKMVAGAGFEKSLLALDISRFVFLVLHFVHRFVHEKISATRDRNTSP
jgi:hypothetical protein